ncbi:MULTISPECIES: sugar porter family MFS transporter [Sphingobium]|jgi:SP family sugar:H+ symporter-like MFS transporter|uniref:D-xylose proton-symporter XylE n=1 Tax=Sphingobium fuliginis (strain ATCC 27551) TaxID=336203 RepID=A0A292ZDE9_SPHSA|nr:MULTISPECIES: sugar porter family MFS transporter [Sphingobium]AJR25822.1 major facilitator transporter [Sphingobium sp. YBL2]MCB4860547.1 sugar porter family MFS transporter [Sphingobium sp. PNB]PNQ04748.1 MFS transporter [Sphingobium sp. SA916]QOT72972.1 sugar porter family MFS transporter [Sphingobium fuliginis]RYM00527.1 MFS transporter [Sphingobium fuliginis]
MSEGSADKVNMAFIAAIVAVATIGGFMFGYDSGVINGTQKGLESAFDLGKLGIGVNVGAILVGSSIGAFLAGRMADLIGRRGVMMLSAALFLVSAILAGAAGSSVIFIVARIVGGLGVGAASVISPVYISEVTPAAVRGRLSSVQQVMIISGLTGAFVANFVLARYAGGSTAQLWLGFPAWRWMFWLQAIPAAIYFLALLVIPESPRYLVARGQEERAQAVLTRLFGAEAASRKVVEIRNSLAADHHRPKLSDLIDKASGKIRPIVWTGIGLAVFQQLVGINVVFYYGATLWEAVGFSEDYALQTNILSGVLSIGACLATIALVDRIGRKPLLLIGSAGMAVTLATVAYAFSTAVTAADGAVSLPGNNGVIALVAANLYVIFFNMSWGPIMWVMLGEMFPNQIRGSGLAVSGFAQWIANALISVSFPALAVSPGLAITYTGYAFFAAVSFFFVRALVHETKGRELEDMVG